MKLYKTTIFPKSNFATPLQGDTIFGHLCWMIVYRYGDGKLKKLLESYKNGKPFLVVSDGFNNGFLPKPKMPSHLLGEDDNKKVNRKKVWIKLEDLQKGRFTKAFEDKKYKVITTIKNKINYKLFRTDGSEFTPFGVREYVFDKKDIYFLLDTNLFSLDELRKIFNDLSEHGYGKDLSIGKGRFEFSEFEELNPFFESRKFMTLSPAVLKNSEKIKDIFYEPFVKFGKHGSFRVNKNPFKKPLVLSNTGSVIEFFDKQDIKYVGCAIEGISTFDDVIHQGYAITIPIGEKYEKV